MLRSLTAALAAVCLVTTFVAPAATRIKDNLTLIQLENGMKIFVYPRHSAPVFAGMIYVDAGSAEEEVGQTGLAHLLEHMAFKGTPWIGTKNWNAEREIQVKIEETGEALNRERQKGQPDERRVEELTKQLSELQKQAAEYIVPNEYDRIITQAGGQEVNATTDVDYTNYFMTVPANKLELWAMMESQRLMYPSWREFYQERDVVAEERRMRTEDSPVGKLYEEFISAAFRAHPYRNPTIGWMPDLYNLTVKKTDDFYKRWYVPENIVAVLVGDVNVDEVRTIMMKYFGTMPKKASPPKATTVEAPQVGEIRIQVEYDAQPQMVMAWHKPTFPEKDMYVFEVIQFLLSRNGRSSRLHERLVKRDAIAQSVEAFTGPGDKYPNLFIAYVTPRAPHTCAEAEAAILDEIERLKREPIGEEELQRTRNQVQAEFLKELETNLGFARKLGYYFLASRDPDIIDNLRDEMQNVTPQDVQRVAQKYFTKTNRTVAELVTKKVETAGAEGAPTNPDAPGAVQAPATMSATGQPVSGAASQESQTTGTRTTPRESLSTTTAVSDRAPVPETRLNDALTSSPLS